MIIGLTGGIGSGKSAVARQMQHLFGYTIYDTDREAKRIIVSDSTVRNAVSKLLGEDVYQGNIYRTDIAAKRLFDHPDRLQKMNAIVHPAVKKDILQHQGKRLIIESALLFESGLASLCDLTIAVIAPQEIRLERAMRRDNATRQQIIARINKQMSDEQMAKQADVLLLNDGKTDLSALAKQAEECILKLAK